MSELVSSLPPVVDHTGETRRNGLLKNPPTLLKSSFPVFEEQFPSLQLTDDQIHALITDPDRVPARKEFDSTWILDQLQHGSCMGHGSAAALSRAMFKRGLPKLLLSGAYAYSLVNGHRDDGAALEDGMRAICEYGDAPLSMVTANMIYPELQPPGSAAAAALHKGQNAYAVKTIQGLRSALAAQWYCAVAIEAGNNYLHCKNGIAGLDNGGGDHCVCVDDLVMVDGFEMFDSPGSWGVKFAIEGRVYLQQRNFLQTMPNHTFFCIPSTDEGGQ